MVEDGDRLDDATMLRLARETRLSETTFVQRPTSAEADYRNRIFTVGGELPFAGHPSLGTAVAVARRAGHRAARLVQQTGAGLQEVEVELDGLRARASMLQEPPELGPEVAPADALAPVGLSARDAHTELLPQVVSTGLANLIVPVAERGALARATLDQSPLDALLAPLGATVLYLVWCEHDAARAQARGFFHGAEDPGTGSAAGSLCAYLHHRWGLLDVEVAQGAEMGRPCRIEAALEGDRVRVGGDVVVVADGELWI